MAVPSPLTPAGCNLQDFPHTPILRSRLFGSSFHAHSTDGEWRAGVTLWLKAWEQIPAGSLPDDDVELCRLAELARDLKTWKKLRAGAMRGWIACNDGRLYHPVVAEVVNNALAAKDAQRAKTFKARLAALEKRLKDAKTDSEKEHITEEIEKLKQAQSQSLSQTMTQAPREEKGREGKRRDISNSVPNGTGGTPPELTKAELWKAAKSMLTEQGMPEKQCGTFVGKLCKDHGDEIALQAVSAAVLQRPADAASFLVAACQTVAGQRLPGWREEQRSRTQQAAPGVAAGSVQADQFFIDVEAKNVPPHALA